MNWLGTSDNFDDGDEDDGPAKRRSRGLHVNDRVRWTIRSDDSKKIVQVLTGTVVAVMIPTAVDANDIWIRWDDQARPQTFKPMQAVWRFEVI